MKFDHGRYLERRRDVCGRELGGRGKRVLVWTPLASLADGPTVKVILADCPIGTREALSAVGVFAAASAGEALPMPPVPVTA